MQNNLHQFCVSVNWHNLFSENENKAMETHIPQHHDSKSKKPQHQDPKTKNLQYRVSETKTQQHSQMETTKTQHCDSKALF